MENNTKPTIKDILGQQALDLLHVAGLRNIMIEDDGTVSGVYQTVEGLPVTKYVKNIRIEIEGKKIMINGDVSRTSVDVGKVI